MPSSRAVFPGSPSVLDDDFLFVPMGTGQSYYGFISFSGQSSPNFLTVDSNSFVAQVRICLCYLPPKYLSSGVPELGDLMI